MIQPSLELDVENLIKAAHQKEIGEVMALLKKIVPQYQLVNEISSTFVSQSGKLDSIIQKNINRLKKRAVAKIESYTLSTRKVTGDLHA